MELECWATSPLTTNSIWVRQVSETSYWGVALMRRRASSRLEARPIRVSGANIRDNLENNSMLSPFGEFKIWDASISAVCPSISTDFITSVYDDSSWLDHTQANTVQDNIRYTVLRSAMVTCSLCGAVSDGSPTCDQHAQPPDNIRCIPKALYSERLADGIPGVYHTGSGVLVSLSSQSRLSVKKTCRLWQH